MISGRTGEVEKQVCMGGRRYGYGYGRVACMQEWVSDGGAVDRRSYSSNGTRTLGQCRAETRADVKGI